MTKFLGIISGKGGVGKTTFAINLATALTKFSRDVIVVDADLNMPNIGTYLGNNNPETNIHSAINGENSIQDSIYLHRSGLKVIPGKANLKFSSESDYEKMKLALKDINQNYELAILDVGEINDAVLQMLDYAIILTTTDLAAVTNCMKIANKVKNSSVDLLGVVINRMQKVVDVPSENVATMMRLPVLAEIPEDEEMVEASSIKHPIVFSHPESELSKKYCDLAVNLIGEN